MKLRLVVAYDGTAFRGWQSQRGGATVQDALEAAVAGIVGERVIVHGSGRTDAGVHALAQTTHFEIPDERFLRLGRLQEPGRWVAALNDALPHELRVLKAARAAANFHARFSATGKIYRYQIWHGPVLPPVHLKRAWHLYGKLDLELLGQLCGMIQGTHDFRGFCADSGSLPKETVRTLRRVILKRRGSALSVTLEGNGFLYRMARMLVGGMVRVAQGKEAIEVFQKRLAAAQPWPTPAMAPAEGLYLVRVLYASVGKRARAPLLDPMAAGDSLTEPLI
jgi:tRNA pseudouridine38-40 synthase